MQNGPRPPEGPAPVELIDPAEPALAPIGDKPAVTGSGSIAHDLTASRIAPLLPSDPGKRFVVCLHDSLAHVSALVLQATGRPLGQGATWVRFVDAKRGTGLLAVVHGPMLLPGGGAEADLILMSDPGMVTRGLLRDLCIWAFFPAGLRRVVARIPADRADLADLARRAGFRHEGAARDYFGPGRDASVWAMSDARCRWLPVEPPSAPSADAVPPSRRMVH